MLNGPFGPMQAPHLPPSAFRIQALHLFRALLRESTYLPDPQARTYVWSHIVTRFRESKNKGIPERQQQLLNEARKSFRILQNANHGKTHQLRKVLLYSYGRMGKRRHELLKPLLEVQAPKLPSLTENSQQKSPAQAQPINKSLASALIEQAASVNKPSDFRPQFPPGLNAVLKSQASAPPTESLRIPLTKKWLQPSLPDTNNLGRKLPRVRMANMIRKWYGTVLDRILPPLPPEEWYQLKGLASGEIEWEGPPARRPGNETRSPTGNAQSELTLDQILDLAFRKPKGSSPADGNHELTPRYMQRLWTNVFSTCPLLTWDPQKNCWNVRWGHRSILKTQQPSSTIDADLFSGVDKLGKVKTG